ncbi:MAG: PilN domain-containing protein [candidate division FCPU426 bacterium]
MIKINLLPLKVRKTKVVVQLTTYLIIGLSVLALLLVLQLLSLLSQTRRLDAQRLKLQAAEASLADQLGPVRHLAEQEKKQGELKRLAGSLTVPQAVWISILDQLSEHVQPDMWLTKLTSQQAKETDPPQLTLEGRAYHKISVADFLTGLEGSGRFRDVMLESLAEVSADDQVQVQFKIKLAYAPAPAPAEAKP